MKPKYSLIIRWSDEDQCYIAWVPEFGTGVKTHGDTYAAAARAGEEVIEMMLDGEPRPGRPPLPTPWLYPDDVGTDERTGAHLFPNNAAYQPPRSSRATPKATHATS